MIGMNCPNCGLYIGGTALSRVQDDVSSATAHCPNRQCGAIYKVTIILIHEGKPIDRLKYVSDVNRDIHTIVVPGLKQSKEPL